MHWSIQRTSQEDATTCIASSGIYFVTRHDDQVSGNVHGEIFYSEAAASAKFDEYDGGDLATGMWDAQLNNLGFYGDGEGTGRRTVHGWR